MESPYFYATPGSTTVVTVKVWPDPPQAVVLAVALVVVLAVALAVRARVWPDTNKFNFRTGLSEG